ncbi:hypothetical protein ACIPX0_47650 [Streptomyces sp. NPDC090075]|uniref:hypothetical protein n=1 Tax=Streptomyces sp. NPDC090075 TaxID=3365937 RepID=UPI00380E65B2
MASMLLCLLAGRALTGVQHKVFASLTRPVFADEETVADLAEPEVAAALGLEPDVAEAMREEQLDMGPVNCRDPFGSPHSPTGQVCHVAPAMCMLCRNAVVFPAHLPRLVLLAEHIETMRNRLAPQQWQAVWGVRPMTLPAASRPGAGMPAQAFADDEPVLTPAGGLLPHVSVPVFGQRERWSGACLRRPSNVSPRNWRIAWSSGSFAL